MAYTDDKKILLHNFLHTCFHFNKSEVSFDSWLILQRFSLLKKIIEKLSKEIESQINISELTGICTLARSGIPFGVLLSLSLNKPLHFYFREPLRFEDKDGVFYHLFPRIKKGGKYLLVDSHSVTLYTASSVAQYIKSEGADCAGLAIAFSFYDMFPSHQVTNKMSPIITLGSATEYKDVIHKIVENNNTDELFDILKNRHKQVYYPDSPFVPPKLFRAWALASGLASLIKNGKEISPIQNLDATLAHKLRSSFGSQESEVWSLFSHPHLMHDIGQHTNLLAHHNQTDFIFAVGLVGTIVSLIIAYSSDFRGSILTTYKPVFLDELFSIRNIKQATIVTGRVRTGMYIRGAYDLLKKKYNITPHSIIALRYVSSGILPPRSLFPYYYIRDLEEILYILS